MSESNGYAGRDAFTTLQRRYTEREIPSFGKVCIRSFSNKEKEELQYLMLTETGEQNFQNMTVGYRARLIIAGVVDPKTKEPLFSDVDFDSLQENIDPIVADVLAEAIIDHADLNRDHVEALKKRLETTPASDSHTG